MLKVVTAEEMRRIDRLTIQRYGLAGIVLMERAGIAAVNRINEIFFHEPVSGYRKPDTKKIVILCGGGNNGGDGFVIARLLCGQGRDVKVFMSSAPRKLSNDAKANYDAAKKFGVRIYPADRFLRARFTNAIIVDALLGTGLNKEVKEPVSKIIRKVDRMNAPVVSVDIPSGISSDTGEVMGCAVKARYTVTFGLPKRGHLLYPGAGHTGRLFIEEIGFPDELLGPSRNNVFLFQRGDAVRLVPERPAYSHKGTYGHVLIVAGSRGKTGAALMAARACLRTGAGLVTIGIPETLVSAFQSRVTEEMVLPLPDSGSGTLSAEAAQHVLDFMDERGSIMALGPGMSVNREISELVARLITSSKKPVVVDADGLNAIAGRTAVLKKSKAPVILTPHPGEMKRLLKSEAGSDKSEGKDDRITTALSFAKRTGAYVLLKGVPTVTAGPSGNAYINMTGNPGMATAGTGDVLTGMIAALLAQNTAPEYAAALGAYLHGLAGDAAAEKKGAHSLTASDIIREVPGALRSIS